MKTITVTIIFSILLVSCSGYRYSMVEDDKRYLLEGEYYNTNPFVYVKAILPNNYIVEKTGKSIASESDIYQCESYNLWIGSAISEGYIEDRGDTVVIKVMIEDRESGIPGAAYENGSYKLQDRSSVENVCLYIGRKYPWLKKSGKLKMDTKACGLSAP